MTLDYKKLKVPYPSDNAKVLYRSGGTNDIIKAILYADAEMRATDKVGNLPKALRGDNDFQTLSNIWHYVKDNMTYKTDKAGHEIVKAPNWMIYFGIGDCKSYSVLIAALMRGNGLKYKYRFVGFDNDRANPTHVYIVAYTRTGEEVIMDAVHTTFNEEPPHTFQIDKTTAAIGGIKYF
jgi:transglutaminase-like putative cysteine protease